MPLLITPETGIPLPFDVTPDELDGFRDRAKALIDTIKALESQGLEIEVTESDRASAHMMAASEQLPPIKALTPAAIRHLDTVLSEYDRELLDVHRRTRVYVTNRLILESTDADAKVRLRALELLGKISGVNLFSERVDMTITHRTVQDIETEIRKTLEIFDAEYTEVPEPGIGSIAEINVAQELGTPSGSEPAA
jgi:hypothetical protein